MLQVFNRFGAKAVIDIIQSLVRVGLTITVYFTGGGLFEIILAELAGRLVRSVGVIGLAFLTARQQWGAGWWKTPLSTLAKDRRSLLTFAFSTNLSATISLVSKDSEDLWVNAFLGNVVGGYYNVARSLIGLLQIPISPLPSTTYPELSRSVARGNWGNVRYVIQRGSRMAILYSLPVTAFLLVFGNWAIKLYAGPEFLPAYPLLIILLIGYTFANVFYWNRVALLAMNRPVFPTMVNFIGMVVKVVLIFLLAQRYQAYTFAGLLSFYYIFTVGVTAGRVMLDLRQKIALGASVGTAHV
jgi:O-antigen/teichoic acid export membrane protein